MLKKNLLIFVFALVAAQILAQESPWKFGMSMYGNASFAILSAEPGYETQADVQRDLYRAKPSIAVQAFAIHPLSKKVFLQLGVGFLDFGEKTKKLDNNLSFSEEIDPFYGFVKPNESTKETTYQIFYNYSAIEIPVQLKVFFTEKIYALGGVSGLVNLRQTTLLYKKTKGESPDFSTYKDENFTNMNALNLAANAGVGYTFCHGKKTDWFVGINAQYLFFPVAHNVNINRKFISGGVTIGMIF